MSPGKTSSAPPRSASTMSAASRAGAIFGGGKRLIPFVVDRAGKHIDDAHAGRRQFGAQALRERQRRRLRRRVSAVRRKVRQRENGEEIDPGDRARLAVGAARAHRRREFLGEPQQAEIIDVHLGARRLDAVAAPRCRNCDDGRRC